MTKNFVKKRLLKCLQVMKIVDIGILRTSTVPQVISEVTKFMDIDIKIPATTPQLIMEVVEICQL